MIKIAVLSDTHSKVLPQKMLRVFESVDCIVHAGDICSQEVLDQLEQIKEVKSVCGNMDEAGLKASLPEHLIFKVEDVNIGVFHGKGTSSNALKAAEEVFKGKDVDIVIFGHSHAPYNQREDDVLYFNPGSPNDTIFAPYCSYGIIEIDKDQISSQIIRI